MGRTKKNTEDVDFSQFAKDTSSQLASDIESVKLFISFGNLAVNFICSGRFINGGAPVNRITEILGPYSSAKSIWGQNIVRGAQQINGIPFLLDTENSFNVDFAARTSHFDPAKVLIARPDCLENAFLKIHSSTNSIRESCNNHLVYIYDSLAVSPCMRELKEINLPENYTQAEFKRIVERQEMPGERAKICNKSLRLLEAVIEKKNVTVVFINQVRKKIGWGSMMGAEVRAGGGGALEYADSVCLRTQRQKNITNKKLKSIIGVHVKVKNLKNKIFRPFVETENIQIFFDHGVNPLSGLLSLLIQTERISLQSKGVYVVNEPWSSGAKLQFRANVTDNLVPLDVLLEAPSLVDAESREEMEAFIEPFKDSIKCTDSEDFEINDASGEDEN